MMSFDESSIGAVKRLQHVKVHVFFYWRVNVEIGPLANVRRAV